LNELQMTTLHSEQKFNILRNLTNPNILCTTRIFLIPAQLNSLGSKTPTQHLTFLKYHQQRKQSTADNDFQIWYRLRHLHGSIAQLYHHHHHHLYQLKYFIQESYNWNYYRWAGQQGRKIYRVNNMSCQLVITSE